MEIKQVYFHSSQFLRIFAPAKVPGRTKAARGTKRERGENPRQYPLLYARDASRKTGASESFTFSATGIASKKDV